MHWLEEEVVADEQVMMIRRWLPMNVYCVLHLALLAVQATELERQRAVYELQISELHARTMAIVHDVSWHGFLIAWLCLL